MSKRYVVLFRKRGDENDKWNEDQQTFDMTEEGLILAKERRDDCNKVYELFEHVVAVKTSTYEVVE